MVLLLNILLPSLLFFFHGVQSYCIHNQFTDGTVIEVRQKRYGIQDDIVFKQHISAGDSKCCHYTNPDCSPSYADDEFAAFEVYFRWPRYKSEKHLVQCVTGGGLSFYGSEASHWAQCSEPSGVVVRARIAPIRR